MELVRQTFPLSLIIVLFLLLNNVVCSEANALKATELADSILESENTTVTAVENVTNSDEMDFRNKIIDAKSEDRHHNADLLPKGMDQNMLPPSGSNQQWAPNYNNNQPQTDGGATQAFSRVPFSGNPRPYAGSQQIPGADNYGNRPQYWRPPPTYNQQPPQGSNAYYNWMNNARPNQQYPKQPNANNYISPSQVTPRPYQSQPDPSYWWPSIDDEATSSSPISSPLFSQSPVINAIPTTQPPRICAESSYPKPPVDNSVASSSIEKCTSDIPAVIKSHAADVLHLAPACKLNPETSCLVGSKCAVRPADFHLDLRTKTASYSQYYNDGRYIFPPLRWTKSATSHFLGCHLQTDLKVRFPRAKPGATVRLKIDLEWAKPKTGRYMFHISDSVGRKGGKGTGAEVYVAGDTMHVFGNQEKGYKMHSLDKDGTMFKTNVGDDSKFSLIIGDQYFSYNNHRDAAVCMMSQYLWLLNGQCRAFEPSADLTLYIGLNKVAASYKATGNGLCNIALTWI